MVKQQRREWINDPDAKGAFNRALWIQALAFTLLPIQFFIWVYVSDSSFSDPQEFQRAGSLGVALAVLAVAMNRFAYEAFEGVFSQSWRYEDVERGRILRALATHDAKLAETTHEGATEEYLFRKLNRPLYSDASGGRKHSLVLMFLEVPWLAIATLQWGYGDKYWCWWSGEGWRVCY